MLSTSTAEADLARAVEAEREARRKYNRANDVVRGLHADVPELRHWKDEGSAMRITDPLELGLYRRNADTGRDACAASLLASRIELKRAAVARANERLEELAPQAAEANDRVTASFAKLGDAVVGLVVAAWAYQAAVLEERRTAEKLTRIALDGLYDDSARDAVKREARYSTPTRISENGVEGSLERTARSHTGPSEDRWWQGLQQIAGLGREKAERQKRNEFVQRAIVRYDKQQKHSNED